ncbi:MAG TPA: hypothetical protein DD735_05820 [Clostridiales bacterium]|nr:hypothetical protein [Clostridiales bacterium]
MFGPETVAEIPVLTGVVNAQGLVKMVAVANESAGRVLSRMFNIKPTIVAFAGSVIVLLENCGRDEEVPRPIHPPLPID